MTHLMKLINYLYNHNLIRYIVVGGTTFLIDYIALIVLHGKLDLTIPIAASIAYWSSIIFNFTMNRWWTFSAADNKNIHKHISAYSVLLLFNYFFTVISISLLSKYISYIIVKPLIVITQTIWTYRIYKHVIFTKNKTISDD